MKYDEVLKFWFEELEPKDWFEKNLELDKKIVERFSEVYKKAIRCELSEWRASLKGRLAEIIILDQFSRNMFRDKKEAFLFDSLALCLSQEAIKDADFESLTPVEKSFLLMPFMHSESKEIHERAVELFSAPGLENNLDFELKHKVIIDRYGRYPHRNEILGRESTKEEVEFLKTPNSSF